MAKQESGNPLKAGETGWILVRIERRGTTTAQRGAAHALKMDSPGLHLLENAQHSSFAERFPRLTFLGIACGLLAFALIAEIDYLSGSGYYWR